MRTSWWLLTQSTLNQTGSSHLTGAPLLWGWGWCIADCCTSPHTRTAWTERSCPPEHDECRRRIRSICAACRVWGCRSTAAYYPPLRNGCVYLRTSRDSGPWKHQLIRDRKQSTLDMNDPDSFTMHKSRPCTTWSTCIHVMQYLLTALVSWFNIWTNCQVAASWCGQRLTENISTQGQRSEGPTQTGMWQS